MRAVVRSSPLLATALVGSALAAGPHPKVEAARERGGLIVFDIDKAGSCAAPPVYDDEQVKVAMSEDKVALVRLDLAKDGGGIREVLGTTYATTPMRVFWKDGQEVDRLCGCVEPADYIAWMRGAEQGKTRAAALRARMGTGFDISGRLELVQAQYCANRIDDAWTTTLELWYQIPALAPESNDIRLSRVARDMAVLARASESVAERIRGMRDELDATRDSDLASLDAWVVLNRVLKDDDRTVAWYDAHKDDPLLRSAIQHQSPNLFALLGERSRWADAGALITDWAWWLDAARPAAGGLQLAVDSYAAMIAAGKAKDAGKYATELLRIGPEGTACKLVEAVLTVGVAAKDQKKLVKSCGDEALAGRWEAALP